MTMPEQRRSENRFSETEMIEGRCRFVSSHCETLVLSHHFFCATEGSIWWWVFVKAHDTRNHRRVTKDWQSPCLNVCSGSLGTWRRNYQRCDLSSFRWLHIVVIVICLSLFIIVSCLFISHLSIVLICRSMYVPISPNFPIYISICLSSLYNFNLITSKCNLIQSLI